MKTVIDVMRENAARPDRALVFRRLDGSERSVPYPQVWAEACRRAHALRALGVGHGDRVALVLPETDEFVLTFLGVLAAGAVAVPAYPPQTMAKLEAYADTLRHVLATSGARVLVTSDSVRPLLAEHLNGHGPRLALERELATADAAADVPGAVSPDDLAFLQFTSGSTSRPKGVMVTHENLAVNGRAIMFDGLRSSEEDRGVTWLPLYHDMGLVGFVVAPLFARVSILFLPTSAFIRRPSAWLDAVHRFRGTLTFAPNFAFSLATRSITERHAAGWDLSCLRAVGCGAEPIQPDVLRAFWDKFAACGLRAGTVLPCYGMAEATLAITFHDLGTPMRTETVRHGAGDLELVSCGRPFPGHDVGVFAEDGRRLGEREVGEIRFAGPSVARGYLGDPGATEETFGGGWLKTGDLGYQVDGDLFVCGRLKDLVIVNGRNYWPQDVERIVSTVDGVRADQCVAFSRLGKDGAERAVVVAEARRGDHGALEAAIVQAVRAELGLTISEVHFIRRGTLPRTSSGKVRRRETRRRLEAGELERLAEGAAAAEAAAEA